LLIVIWDVLYFLVSAEAKKPSSRAIGTWKPLGHVLVGYLALTEGG
jgi:hypothetical protein